MGPGDTQVPVPQLFFLNHPEWTLMWCLIMEVLNIQIPQLVAPFSYIVVAFDFFLAGEDEGTWICFLLDATHHY